MAKTKKSDEYVVGILSHFEDRIEIKYVTSVGYQPKMAYWKAGEEAMIFSKDYAKDLAFGLCVNGYVAIPMLKAEDLNLSNPTEEREEEKFLEIYREDYSEGQFNEILSTLGLNDDEVGDAFIFKGTVVKNTLKK